MTTAEKSSDLTSFSSTTEASNRIKHLFESENKEENFFPALNDISTSEDTVNNSPVYIDCIFPIDLNFADIKQINKQAEFVKKRLENSSRPGNNLINGYVWVEISAKGEIIVIGKTTTSSDLFKTYLRIHPTERELIKRYCTKEDQAVFQRCIDQVNQAVVGAVIIMIQAKPNISDNDHLKKAERLIGERIVKSFNVLNQNSHLR